MYTITNTYNEPIVITLLAEGTIRGVPNRMSINLNPGDALAEYPPGKPILKLSPEVIRLRTKGCVSVSATEGTVKPAPTPALPVDCDEQPTTPTELDVGPRQYSNDLEQQLLGADVE